MSIHTKIITTGEQKTLINDTLLDRDLVLSLKSGDVLFHGGFRLFICSRIFITSGSGGDLTAKLIVIDGTE